MGGSTFGRLFRVTTAGESHGPANVVIVDGAPAGLEVDASAIAAELARRRPGQSALVSARAEPDEAEILSGVLDGRALGSPIAILVRNRDAQSADYAELADVYRPGHADFTHDAKYGRRDPRGGGRASARETVARVAAGAIARRLLEHFGVQVVGWVQQIGEVAAEVDPLAVTRAEVEATPVRCPDRAAAARMIALVEAVRAEGDSIGGIARVVAKGVPAGWGEPVFDKLKADLAKALASLPAVQGVEFGAGFAVATARGSANNDAFVANEAGAGVRPATNRHGGMLGGLSSGEPILVGCAVKPPSSIARAQTTARHSGEPAELEIRGRHDPCVLPRFVPLAEAMVLLALADHALRQRTSRLP